MSDTEEAKVKVNANVPIPSDIEIRKEMEQLMQTVNLETMSTKQFIATLSEKFNGADLSSKKKYIKATITEIIDSMQDSDDESSEEDSSSEEEEEEEMEVVVPKKRKQGGGGLSAVKEISQELADFLGSGRQMARTDIVKAMWAYIKDNELQNPDDRRQILLDDRMKAVFGVDQFTMFSMNKYIGAHVDPYKPVDLTTNTTAPRKKRKSNEPKKKRDPGTMPPYRLSEDLTAVVGKNILPRPQVTQALWVYIKANNLQNPENKKEIICDEALSRVFGGESKVTMFSMHKYISPHLLEKLDKSAYVHEEIDANIPDEFIGDEE